MEKYRRRLERRGPSSTMDAEVTNGDPISSFLIPYERVVDRLTKIIRTEIRDIKSFVVSKHTYTNSSYNLFVTIQPHALSP